MSYFGNSGPKSNFAYSIGAGYARRSNQIAARRTAPLGNFNDVVKNAQNRLVNAYDERFTAKYGDPLDLKQRANDYSDYLENYHAPILEDYKLLVAEGAYLQNKKRELTRLHLEIHSELSKDQYDIDMNKVQKDFAEAEKLEPNYRPESWESIEKRIDNEIETNEKNLKIAKNNLKDSDKKLREEFLGDIEDYFVDGPLVHERKAMMVSAGGVTLGLLIVAVLYFNQPERRPRLVSGNQSAAMAVFG